MKALDRYLQRCRIDKTRPYIKKGVRVLDIGCDDGALFRDLPAIGEGVGMDPDLKASTTNGNVSLIKGYFPKDLPDSRPFDLIILLAVLEHIPQAQQETLAQDSTRFLVPGGHVLITVPSPWVDPILSVLMFLRIMDGTRVDQHYGFEASTTPAIFSRAGLELAASKKFQFGLNNFFAFRKPG